jgi:transcriptional regulator with XRE-family HTH domain
LQLLYTRVMNVSVIPPGTGEVVTAAMVGGRMRLGELGTFIREQRRAARLSLRKMSDLAGISNPYLSQIERGLRKPSAEILQAIAKALRISAETLYVRAGILDERPDHDLVSEILKDPAISERQKQRLIDLYRDFVEANKEPHERAASITDVTGDETREDAAQM